MFVLLFRSIRQKVRARAVAENHLQQLNAGLEQRVQERTSELQFLQTVLGAPAAAGASVAAGSAFALFLVMLLGAGAAIGGGIVAARRTLEIEA